MVRDWFKHDGERSFRAGGDIRFAFVAKHRHIWPVSWLCDVPEVSRSGFHARLNRPNSTHEIHDAKLVTRSRRASKPATGPMARAASGAMPWREDWPAGFIGSND